MRPSEPAERGLAGVALLAVPSQLVTDDGARLRCTTAVVGGAVRKVIVFLRPRNENFVLSGFGLRPADGRSSMNATVTLPVLLDPAKGLAVLPRFEVERIKAANLAGPFRRRRDSCPIGKDSANGFTMASFGGLARTFKQRR